jgi:hypothetical protein
VPRTPDKGIILSRIPRTPSQHGKTSRLTIEVTGSTVAVPAVASATASIWPAGAAEQQPTTAPQNSELQQAAGPPTAADLAATGADTTGGPATQISWALGYIRDLYGSPRGARNHELATGSY